MNPVISVEHLSKAYRLGQIGSSTLSDDLNIWWAKVRGKRHPWTTIGEPDFTDRIGETILALKDVNFAVEQGEVLGIIGRNGAGKSTLLKILSRVTAPSSGKIKVKGRIASLLEIGTGFHPDLTGRENTYLNGAILGMSRKEIESKFDAIVDFSGVEKFIDTPVKRYSSGMYVRLAFAVAAHLEPEILIVDEVLAVGDTEFQKKCLGKMGAVAEEGRTVLFVSHSMQAITSLCPSTILLNNGKVEAQGPTAQVVGKYLTSSSRVSAEASWRYEEAPGTEVAKLHSVKVMDEQYQVCYEMSTDKPIILQAKFWLMREVKLHVSFHIFNQQGVLLFATGNFHDPAWSEIEHEPGFYSCSCIIPDHYLNEGQHSVKVYLSYYSAIEVRIPEAVSFNVHDAGDTRYGWTGDWQGLVRPVLAWSGERVGDLP